MADFPLVTTSQGVLAIGGEQEYSYLKEYSGLSLLNLECQDEAIENCQWQESELTLKYYREQHVALSLWESFECALEPRVDEDFYDYGYLDPDSLDFFFGDYNFTDK